MSNALSPDTQAILLTTAPLLAGRATPTERPLTLDEYNRLAGHLRAAQRRPADLLGDDADVVVRGCAAVVDEARLRRLLERGFLLGQAVERWHGRALWVISRADPAYPRRVKQRLGLRAPPLLYGCGDVALLAGNAGIVVVTDGLERRALLREHRDALMGGRLVLVSAADPGAVGDGGDDGLAAALAI